MAGAASTGPRTAGRRLRRTSDLPNGQVLDVRGNSLSPDRCNELQGSRRQSLSGLAKITFGVYLVHDLFLIVYRHFGITQLPLPPVLAVPAVTALALIPSAAVAWLISKIPFAGRYLT